MATLQPCFIFLFSNLLLVAHTLAQFSCKSTSCVNGGVSIQFPFWLRKNNQSQSPWPWCSYPGFELSCSNTTGFSEPLVNLPETGDFAVKLISLQDQVVWINDPDECLPNRIMRSRGLNLEGSPFKLSTDYNVQNFSFLSCPSNLSVFSLIQPISCLGSSFTLNNNNIIKKKNDGGNNNLNYSVVAMVSDPPFPMPWAAPCHVISWALIPVAGMTWLFWNDYDSDIKLEWKNPNCGSCEARGGRCGFLEPKFWDTAFRVGCYDHPTHVHGISREAKYNLGLFLGIPGLACMIWLTCLFYKKKQTREPYQQPPITTTRGGGGGGDISAANTRVDYSTLIMVCPPAATASEIALDRYPKTLIGGECERVPKPSDNTCSICLSEYQPKEVLRSIPGCNHYFHANCINGWLNMNSSCPLCRKLTHRKLLLNPPPYPVDIAN